MAAAQVSLVAGDPKSWDGDALMIAVKDGSPVPSIHAAGECEECKGYLVRFAVHVSPPDTEPELKKMYTDVVALADSHGIETLGFSVYSSSLVYSGAPVALAVFASAKVENLKEILVFGKKYAETLDYLFVRNRLFSVWFEKKRKRSTLPLWKVYDSCVINREAIITDPKNKYKAQRWFPQFNRHEYSQRFINFMRDYEGILHVSDSSRYVQEHRPYIMANVEEEKKKLSPEIALDEIYSPPEEMPSGSVVSASVKEEKNKRSPDIAPPEEMPSGSVVSASVKEEKNKRSLEIAPPEELTSGSVVSASVKEEKNKCSTEIAPPGHQPEEMPLVSASVKEGDINEEKPSDTGKGDWDEGKPCDTGKGERNEEEPWRCVVDDRHTIDMYDLYKIMSQGFQKTQDDMKKIHDDMKTMHDDIQLIRDELKFLRIDVSSICEATVRTSLAQFVKDKYGKVLSAYVDQVPYTPHPQLERLKDLCAKLDEKGARQTPDKAEIDCVLRFKLNGDSYFLGEITRSWLLNEPPYHHPSEPDRSPTTKLLYKMIQLERAVLAVEGGETQEGTSKKVVGVAVVSPSFRRTTPEQANQLVKQVIDSCPEELASLGVLFAEGNVFLWNL